MAFLKKSSHQYRKTYPSFARTISVSLPCRARCRRVISLSTDSLRPWCQIRSDERRKNTYMCGSVGMRYVRSSSRFWVPWGQYTQAGIEEGPTGLGRFRGKQHEKRSISMKVHMADGGTKQGRSFPRLGRELAGSFILDSFAGSDWAVCQGSDLAPLVNHSKCTSRQLTLLLEYLSHAHVGRSMNLGSVRSRPYLDPRLLGLYSRLGSLNFSCSNYVHLVGENMY